MHLDGDKAASTSYDFQDELIAVFRTEMKRKDDEYVRLLKRQADDVTALITAMEEQYAQLQGAHKEEVEEVEEAYNQVGVPFGEVVVFGRGPHGPAYRPRVLWYYVAVTDGVLVVSTIVRCPLQRAFAW